MIFLLVPYLLLELYLSLKVGESIGFFASVLWIAVTMFVGIQLLYRAPEVLVGNLFRVAAQGRDILDAFHKMPTYYTMGAIFLIIPGVLSDFLGILAMIYAFYLQFSAKMKPEQNNPFYKKGEDDVIDVEIIDDHTGRNPRT